MPTPRTTYHVTHQTGPDAKSKPVTVEPLGNNHYAVTVDGQRREVCAQALPQGGMALFIGTKAYTVELEAKGADIIANLKGQRSRFDVADERTLRQRAASAAFSVEGKQVITAPMPGKLVKVLVKVGDEVKEGQGLVVVEAMKMENELKAPKAGKVTEVVVKEGATVENGAKLVVVE